MKKTFTINLNNTVFHIDSDAYDVLKDYLSELHKYFAKEEDGVDILNDIEARIAELFQNKMNERKNVIIEEDVLEVIETMGRPSQFGETIEEEGGEEFETKEEKKSKHKKLYRDIDNRLLGGVLAGISAYLKWDVSIVRIVFFVLVFISQSSLALVYFILWIIIPKAQTTAQKLEMHGEDVNISTIKNKATDEKERFNAEKFKESTQSFAERMWIVFKGLLKLAFTFIGVIISIIGGILIALLIFTLIIYLFEPEVILRNFPEFFTVFKTSSPEQIIMLLVSLIIIIGTPIFAINYWSINILSGSHKTKRSNYPVFVTLIVWFVGIFMFAATGGGAIKESIRLNNLKRSIEKEWSERAFDEENILSEERELASFHSLQVSDGINIEWTQSDVQNISVTTLSDFVPNVHTELYDGVLRIYSDNKLINPKIVVKISSDSLQKIRATGASSVKINSDAKFEDLDINLSGASKISASEVSAQNLNIDISGASKVMLMGEADSITIEASGASKAELDEMKAKVVKAQTSGASKVNVFATDEFEGNASGASKINCYGSPMKKDKYRSDKSSSIRFL